MLRKATFGNSLSSSLKKVRAIPGTAQNFFQCKSCLFAEVSNRSHAGKAVTKFNPLNLEYNFAEINFGDTVNVTHPSNITANLPHSSFVAKLGFTSTHLVAANGFKGLWLRYIGEVSPPYFSAPSTETDTLLPTDAPIVINVDQPIQTLDGTPIPPGDVKDLITVTKADGTPVDYTATLEENLSDITIIIENAEPDSEYRISIAPVSNEEGLQTQPFSYLLRTAPNAPPTATNLSLETPKDTPYQFTAEDFTAGYADPEGAPLDKVKILAVPGYGTLTLDGGSVPLDAEIPLAQLSDLTYTPSGDFIGTDQWQFAVSDGNSHSDPATVTISVTPVTGIADEESLWAITYHPNPIVDKLIIHNQGRRNIEWLSIMDVNGRPLSLPREKGGDTITIHFGDVPAGVYVMAIRFEGKLHYRRLVRR